MEPTKEKVNQTESHSGSPILNKINTIMDETQKETVAKVKSLLPYFDSIKKWSNGKIINFDYGHLYNDGIWEATLTLWNGVNLEFTCGSVPELYDTVEETVETLNLN